MSRIISDKTNNRLFGRLRAASPRVLAFCIMVACLIVTLAVTAANMRLTYVAGSDGEQRFVAAPVNSTAQVTPVVPADPTPSGRTYYTAFGGDLADLNIDRMLKVSIYADGETRTVTMVYGTVAAALERAGVTLDEDDYTEPALDEIVTVGSQIKVHRVDYQEKVETQVMAPETEYIYTSLYFRNKNKATVLQNGAEGECVVTTSERWVDGELENSIVTDVTTTVQPLNHIIKVYGEGAPVSPLTGPDGTTNAPTSYSRVLTGKATGYYAKSGKGASGLGLGYGTVAVDPRVIPYGTLLYIASTDGSFVYGYAIATDTGLALRNGHVLVDLFYETYAESLLNGAIQVNVYVVG